MHTVDRGPEPAGLKKARERLTPRWVRYYRERKGKKPADARWRDFQSALSEVFFNLCAYCEQVCKGEVDHFRPKSLFPEHVYEWSNWVYACHTCNHNKLEKWPRGGYVDPCAKSAQVRPEAHFDFDTKTAEIVPKTGATAVQRRRALATIQDLGLNGYHHRKARTQCLELVKIALAGVGADEYERKRLAAYVASRERAFSSITRKLLRELGCHVSDN
jgi:uncharacterized protein (TIGR02646 family)